MYIVNKKILTAFIEMRRGEIADKKLKMYCEEKA
jgi:hypothetical protein